jgi:cytochrome P450
MLLAHDLFDPTCLQDPYPLYDRMRAGSAVQRVGESSFYAATSFDAVVEATARPQDFSSNLTATMWHHPDGTVSEFAMEGPGGATHVLATAEDPSHAAHRKLVLPRLAAEDPSDDLLGDFATEQLSADTAALMLVQLVSAGAESTASLIGSAVRILARRPDIADRLRQDGGLIPVFLEEVLRYESPFRGHFRHVLDDSALGGTSMPAGSHLLLLWGAANRDPAAFDDPHEFRMDRASAKGHLAFGRGAHFCVGAALARLEARVVISELLRVSSVIQPAGNAEWLPSLLVRRLRRLPLTVR